MTSMSAQTTKPLPFALAAGFGVLLLCSAGPRAEFVLNWTADTASPAFNTLGCATPAACSVTQDTEDGDSLTIPGQTPFLYETVTDANGIVYYHLVIDDPAAGFAQEVYIQTGSGLQASVPPRTFPGGAVGLTTASSSSRGEGAQVFGEEGSGVDPLSSDSTFSGNSSGNPERVQMRQLITSDGMTDDFIKDRFLDKPNIINTIDATDFNTTFIMDSTGNRYNSLATPSTVTITLDLFDPAVPDGSNNFDLARDSQNSSVTAGRYTYTPAPIPPQTGDVFGGSGGTYQYFDGSASLNPNWDSFFDHNEANPWSYERLGNRPVEP